MGRVGSCYETATAESFFAILKEEIGTRVWPDRATARAEVFAFIETVSAGVGLVAQDSGRLRAWAAGVGSRNADPVEDLTECGGVVDIAGREHDGQGQAPAVDGEVDLGGQPASGPAEGLARLRADRIFQFVPVCGPLLRAPAACW